MNTTKSSLYTRTGDAGATGLRGGKRIGKDSLRIQALGDLDELNCQLGCVLALAGGRSRFRPVLGELQHLLFELGAELATPGGNRLQPAHIDWAEQTIDELDAALPALRNFVLPGGVPAAAQCHLARAVCRRAERSLFRLAREEPLNSVSVRFLNRLSDLLFALARILNLVHGVSETPWVPEEKAAP